MWHLCSPNPSRIVSITLIDCNVSILLTWQRVKKKREAIFAWHKGTRSLPLPHPPWDKWLEDGCHENCVISHADLHRKMMGRPTQEGRAWAEAHHARPAYHGVDDMIEDWRIYCGPISRNCTVCDLWCVWFVESPHASWGDVSWVHHMNFGGINPFLMNILIISLWGMMWW